MGTRNTGTEVIKTCGSLTEPACIDAGISSGYNLSYTVGFDNQTLPMCVFVYFYCKILFLVFYNNSFSRLWTHQRRASLAHCGVEKKQSTLTFANSPDALQYRGSPTILLDPERYYIEHTEERSTLLDIFSPKVA